MICEVRPLESASSLKAPPSMHVGGHQGGGQPTDDYSFDYSSSQHQQPQPSAARPAIDEYYMQQQPLHQQQQLHQQYPPQQVPTLHAPYFPHPMTAPAPLYMRPTLYPPGDSMDGKRKGLATPLGAVGSQLHKAAATVVSPEAALAAVSASPERICDVCRFPDAVLASPPCGHQFHSRCVHTWPCAQCPVCDVAVPQLRVLRLDMNAQLDTRSGKWTRAEEKFIDVILTEFDRNALPLANGTPVRLVLAKLLNCSTMRLSKKFQKNALGKRTFRLDKPVKGAPSLAFDRHDHVRRQVDFSRAEAVFRHELVEQFRRENNTDEGAFRETIDLRRAVQQFWVANFLKLAVLIVQPVEGLDISDAKKKKQALLMLRNGQYDELLSWNRSPANATSVSPMPGRDGVAQWAPMAPGMVSEPYLAAFQGVPEEKIGVLEPQRSFKKMRTPEGSIGMQRFEQQPQLPGVVDPAMSGYAYGKVTPPTPSSYGQLAYQQQQQQQPQTQQFVYASQQGYSPFSIPKAERAPTPTLGYSNVLNQQQMPATSQAPLAAYDVNDPRAQARVMPPVYARNPGEENAPPGHPTNNQQAATAGSGPSPWDELLEDMSEPTAQVVDPSLQAWSNLHML